MLPYVDTADDVSTFLTGCGLSCQAGYEEPVGWEWRAVAGAGIFLPIGVRSARTAVGLVDDALGFVNRLCSFSAETVVITEDGPVLISEVETGTLMLA